MRKLLCMILTLLVLVSLLTGCGEVPAPIGPNMESTNPAENESRVPTVTLARIPDVKDPGSSLIEYDPEREYYIHTGNINTTHYCEGVTFTYQFDIFSTREIERGEISIDVLCENEYTYTIEEYVSDTRDTIFNQSGEVSSAVDRHYLPYYVYMNYWSPDFDLIMQVYDIMENPPEKGTKEAEDADKLTGGKDPNQYYRELLDLYVPAFQELKPEDTRDFYIYTVGITFAGNIEETITGLDITIDGQTNHQEIGHLHLVPGSLPLKHGYAMGNGLGVGYNGVPFLTFANNLYAETGLAQLDLFYLCAEKDLALEELHFFNNDTEMLDLYLTITTIDGSTVTTRWDGKSTYDLFTGDQFTISAVIRDPNLLGLYYYLELNYELIVSIEGEKYSHYNNLRMYPLAMNFHEIYAIAFDGLDMESYYKDYYYPVYEPWRAEYED